MRTSSADVRVQDASDATKHNQWQHENSNDLDTESATESPYHEGHHVVFVRSDGTHYPGLVTHVQWDPVNKDHSFTVQDANGHSISAKLSSLSDPTADEEAFILERVSKSSIEGPPLSTLRQPHSPATMIGFGARQSLASTFAFTPAANRGGQITLSNHPSQLFSKCHRQDFFSDSGADTNELDQCGPAPLNGRSFSVTPHFSQM